MALAESDTLSFEDAVGALPEGDAIHTFRGGGPVLLGADWSRQSIIDALLAAPVIAKTGGMAQAMGHGIAIEQGGSALFIATAARTDGDDDEKGD